MLDFYRLKPEVANLDEICPPPFLSRYHRSITTNEELLFPSPELTVLTAREGRKPSKALQEPFILEAKRGQIALLPQHENAWPHAMATRQPRFRQPVDIDSYTSPESSRPGSPERMEPRACAGRQPNSSTMPSATIIGSNVSQTDSFREGFEVRCRTQIEGPSRYRVHRKSLHNTVPRAGHDPVSCSSSSSSSFSRIGPSWIFPEI